MNHFITQSLYNPISKVKKSLWNNFSVHAPRLFLFERKSTSDVDWQQGASKLQITVFILYLTHLFNENVSRLWIKRVWAMYHCSKFTGPGIWNVEVSVKRARTALETIISYSTARTYDSMIYPSIFTMNLETLCQRPMISSVYYTYSCTAMFITISPV